MFYGGSTTLGTLNPCVRELGKQHHTAADVNPALRLLILNYGNYCISSAVSLLIPLGVLLTVLVKS